MATKKLTANEAWEAFMEHMPNTNVVLLMSAPMQAVPVHCITNCESTETLAILKTTLAAQEGRVELCNRVQ